MYTVKVEGKKFKLRTEICLRGLSLSCGLLRTRSALEFTAFGSGPDAKPGTYVQITQLRNLRFFVLLRKIAKIARSTIFRVHLRFFAVVSLVNDISRKRVENFAKIAKNRKANDFSRSLAIFRRSVITDGYPARNRSISRSGFHVLATALRCFTLTPRQKDFMCFWLRLRKNLWAYEFVSFIIPWWANYSILRRFSCFQFAINSECLWGFFQQATYLIVCSLQ